MKAPERIVLSVLDVSQIVSDKISRTFKHSSSGYSNPRVVRGPQCPNFGIGVLGYRNNRLSEYRGDLTSMYATTAGVGQSG